MSQFLRLNIHLAIVLRGLARDLTSQIDPINDRALATSVLETYPERATSEEGCHRDTSVRPHHVWILRDRRESDSDRRADSNRHPEHTGDHRAQILWGIVESDLNAGHQDPDFAERSEYVARRLDPDVDARWWGVVDEMLQHAGVDHAELGAEEAESDASDWVEVNAGFAESWIDGDWCCSVSGCIRIRAFGWI